MKIALDIQNEFDPDYIEAIRQLTGLPILNNSDADQFSHSLCLDESGLSLQRLQSGSGETNQQPTRVDFKDAALQYRLNSFGKQQGLAKAVGLNRHEPMHVLDATAGLGRDAFILASMGCQLTMLEQSSIIYALLQDGFKRAELTDDEELHAILHKMTLHHADARNWFDDIRQGKQPEPDVIYLDPMFPPRHKSASVKKDIALLQDILGYDEDSQDLIASALGCARHRVVVKRLGSKPQKPGKGGIKPGFIVPGKTAHFEVYV